MMFYISQITVGLSCNKECTYHEENSCESFLQFGLSTTRWLTSQRLKLAVSLLYQTGQCTPLVKLRFAGSVHPE